MAVSVPVAAGPPVAVTTEVSYCAFPYAVVDATGRAWVAYSNSAGHVSATGDVRLRFADPGCTWSAPAVVTASSGGYGVGVGGFAAETAEQGGKLWLACVRNKPTSGSTAADYTTTVRSLDTATGLWTIAVTLPAIATGQTVGSGLLVRPDGTLLATAYGTPDGGTYTVAKVYAYDRAAGTWAALSTVSLTTRLVQEPTLLTMADGRLLMLFRSDGSAPYYSYIFSVVSADGGLTWGTPYVVAVHASGMPHGYVTPSGHIAVTYRGFTEPRNPAASYPPRIMMLNPDGTSTGDGAIDVLGGQTARFLYGRIIAGEPDQFIYSLEGPAGQSGAGAAIYSVPLEWVARSS